MPTIEPVTPQPHLPAFAGYGIELEYMIVDRETLKARPLADRLLSDLAGEVVNEARHDGLAWSNELVMHVIELKTDGPSTALDRLAKLFSRDVRYINGKLLPLGAMLLPTAMHPLFDPEYETTLWPHGQSEIYAAYDRIFGCRGHGWSNLQSTHINLPFANDDEFRRLHAAVRVVLPLIPAIAASSPIEGGRPTGWLDRRLHYYRVNQQRIPEIAGAIVPEAVEGIADYHWRVLKPMYGAIEPLDPDGILQDDWLNSRGAIARFERQSIEIRLIDIQECPSADLTVAEAVIALVRRFYNEQLAGFEQQQAVSSKDMAEILFSAAEHGAQSRIDHGGWLALFGIDRPTTAGRIWQQLLERGELDRVSHQRTLARIIKRGPLAAAILQRVGRKPKRHHIDDCYRELAECLAKDRLFRA